MEKQRKKNNDLRLKKFDKVVSPNPKKGILTNENKRNKWLTLKTLKRVNISLERVSANLENRRRTW